MPVGDLLRLFEASVAIHVRTMTAYNLAVAFCAHWILKYGPPRIVVLDNAQNFSAKFFLAVCRHLGIANKFVTTYYPQSNGQVERYSRTITVMLQNYLNNHQDYWDMNAEALTYATISTGRPLRHPSI